MANGVLQKQRIVVTIRTNELSVVNSEVGIESYDNDELNRKKHQLEQSPRLHVLATCYLQTNT